MATEHVRYHGCIIFHKHKLANIGVKLPKLAIKSALNLGSNWLEWASSWPPDGSMLAQGIPSNMNEEHVRFKQVNAPKPGFTLLLLAVCQPVEYSIL